MLIRYKNSQLSLQIALFSEKINKFRFMFIMLGLKLH